MKIETFKTPTKKTRDTFSEALRQLKPGQALRLKTAQDYRSATAVTSAIGKKRGIKFRTANDGEGDVLVYVANGKL